MKNKFLSFIIISLLFSVSFIFSGCTGSKNSYHVVAMNWNSRYGQVEDPLDKDFVEGTNVTINATPIPSTSSEFVCWVHENKIVSTEAKYNFEVSLETSGTYYAVFTCPELEFVSMENFTFTNILESNDEFLLKDLKIEIGNSKDFYRTVYTSTEEDLSTLSVAKSFEELYVEDPLPYVFDKLKNIDIKITVNYLLSENEYISVTEKTIPAINLGQTIEELTFNLEKAVMPNTTIELVGSEQNQFIINFTSIENFEFQKPENSEENN